MSSEPKPNGRVICFASAKGGTGKTVLAVSAAYLLATAGRRVLLIDSDFSTRGLSIFLLAGVLGKNRESFERKNCLVEAFLEDIPAEKVEPVEVDRDGVIYRVLLSNHDLWLESIPDDRVLGVRAESTVGGWSYYRYLKRLCEHLRSRYDHILIDTRGGYDFTSAVPAVVADEVVVVIEDNIVTQHQFIGLINSFRKFAKSVEANVEVSSVVINKVVEPYDHKDRKKAETGYGYPVLSAVPADVHLILSYQDCRIPLEQYPECDFSRYAAEAIQNLFAPQKNWTGDKGVKAAEKFRRKSKTILEKAVARRLVDDIARFFPWVQVVLGVAACFLFWLYFAGLSATWFVTALGIFAALAGGVEFMRWVRLLPFNKRRNPDLQHSGPDGGANAVQKAGRVLSIVAASALWIGLIFAITKVSNLVALSYERAAQKERAYEAFFTSLEALTDRGVRLTDAARIMHGIPPVLGSDSISDDERRNWSNEALYVWVVIPTIVENDKAGTAERLEGIIRTRNWSKFHALRAYLASDAGEKAMHNQMATELNNQEVARSGKRSPIVFNNLAWSLFKLHEASIERKEPPDPKRLIQAFELAEQAIVFDDLSIARDDRGEPLRFVRAGFYDTQGEICAALADLPSPPNPPQDGLSWRAAAIAAFEKAVSVASIPAEKRLFQESLKRQEEKRQDEERKDEKERQELERKGAET